MLLNYAEINKFMQHLRGSIVYNKTVFGKMEYTGIVENHAGQWHAI